MMERTPAAAPNMKPDRHPKAVSRRHRGRLGPASDGIGRVFRHVRDVAKTAALVSRQTGITDTFTIDTMVYRHVRDLHIRAAITQAAIKTGVAAMKAAGPDTEPEFKVPTIKLNHRCWHLNPVAGGYLATGNIGPRMRVAIGVPKSVGDRISEHRLGELTITPDRYVISYTKDVEPMPDRDPSLGNKYHVSELASGVDRVAGPPKGVLGVDINTTNVTISSGSATIQIDMADAVGRVLAAKTRQNEATKRDNSRWEGKRGRPISHTREEVKEGARRLTHGGRKKHNKLKRDLRGIERRRDAEKDDVTRHERETLAIPRKGWRDKIRELKGNPKKQNEVRVERDAVAKAAKAETGRLKKEADDRCKQAQGRLTCEMERCVVPRNGKGGASPMQKRTANDSKMRGAARASRHLENVMHVVSLFVVGWRLPPAPQ